MVSHQESQVREMSGKMSKLAIALGVILLAIAFGASPIPLEETLNGPTRSVTIYPNVLLAVPMILLGALLLLYGVTVNNKRDS